MSLITWFKKIILFCQNIFFPIFCLGCHKEGEWLCLECLNQTAKKIIYFCPHCYKENLTGKTCLSCQSPSFLEGALALADYKNEIIAQAIQLLKYNYVEELAEVLGRLLLRVKDVKLLEIVAGGILIPVPLHQQRFLERGFNQSFLIAQSWSKILSVPVTSDILVRQRFTTPQAKLGAEERRRNLLGAFVLKSHPLADKIILIDDVFTTGSTLQECAGILKKGGVKEVWALTVARER